MNKNWHDKIVLNIEKLIIDNINQEGRMLWRDLVIKKNQLNYQIINSLAYLLKKSNGLKWKFEDEVLNSQFFTEHQEELNIFLKDKIQKIDLSNIYQLLLADDIVWNGEKYVYVVDKQHRDNLGAYYTPEDLSYFLTEKTFLTFLKNNKPSGIDTKSKEFLDWVSTLRVADLSVGSGVFLTSYLEVVKSHVSSNEQFISTVIENLYGSDVDPVALLISEFNISNKYNLDCSRLNLILGNPLLNECEGSNLEELASQNRFYNKSMSIIDKLSKINGFDIVLGNPPWEKIRFEERNFFSIFNPEISNVARKNERKILIDEYKEISPKNYAYYKEYKSDYDSVKKNLKSNPRLKYSLYGELNTYSLFYELSYNILNECGSVGLLVKSSMVKTPANGKLFRHLVDEKHLESVDIFINSEKIFPIDSREEFAFVISSKTNNKFFSLRSGIRNSDDYKDIQEIDITGDNLVKINPTNRMIPNCDNMKEFEFLLRVSKKFRTFDEVFPNVYFGRLVHLTNHSEHIGTKPEDGIPIYEGKFIERYDSMYSTYKGKSYEDRYKPKASSILQTNSKQIPESRYYINQNFWKKISKNYSDIFTIMWRSLTSTTNKRTMLATVLPFMPTAQSIQFLQANDEKKTIIILAIFNSVIFDYIVRLKMPGIDLTQSVIKDIPVPEIKDFDKIVTYKGYKTSIYEHIKVRIGWLYRNDPRVSDLFNSKVYAYKSSKIMECEKEIDELIAKLYQTNDEEIKRIASNFLAYYSNNK
ncbi:Eco57I restriction-modification methylase domain-containing protein [Facklamia miroungae]|uniref:site-specific DNA-methyltransferase (adenine-specific) n=1 Tax=Facklamia miroungae TaxID=120956 RepID=A0A1G7RFI2_9LACT|nr:N-6 DNA methylase [Facklamia miroungae]NKZ29451.1 N-6 DNA methylase [Facklamia miroungae]SDG08889.1 N-6 DNA Methylase [Facklamia miroungae]